MHIGARALAVFLATVFLVTPALSQEVHVVDQAAMERAVSESMSEDDAHREAVLRLLRRGEVHRLAAKVRLDLRQAEAAVSTLEGEELARLASLAREAESQLAGGQSKVTVSTTMIIIGLLVLILIIVAV